MDETQIDILEKHLADGNIAGWVDGLEMRRIIKVIPSFDDEPSRCATLVDGRYIALWNVEPDDIISYSHMFR